MREVWQKVVDEKKFIGGEIKIPFGGRFRNGKISDMTINRVHVTITITDMEPFSSEGNIMENVTGRAPDGTEHFHVPIEAWFVISDGENIQFGWNKTSPCTLLPK